jgi:hypothetical protein
LYYAVAGYHQSRGIEGEGGASAGADSGSTEIILLHNFQDILNPEQF